MPLHTRKLTKRTPAKPVVAVDALTQALAVRDHAAANVTSVPLDEQPKHIDAWQRAANVVRQLEKDRKRAIASYTDDEIIEHLRSLPERRRDAIITAAQGASLAGKPLFG